MASEHAGELEIGLLIEGHGVEVQGRDASGLQAVVEGPQGQVRGVLAAKEALFLGRGHEPALPHEAAAES